MCALSDVNNGTCCSVLWLGSEHDAAIFYPMLQGNVCHRMRRMVVEHWHCANQGPSII